jgi:hypothetical protein
MYSPTLMRDSLRIFIYLISVCQWHSHVFDIKVAFLHEEMDAEVWVKLPEGYPGYDPLRTLYVRLLKALYGTKQAMLRFAIHRDEILRNAGYSQLISDKCIWMRVCPKGFYSYIGTHVDDFPLVSQRENSCCNLF